MITLYELHWSHYCEKIRWALAYKKIDWEKINISAFSKKEMQAFSSGKKRMLVPFIYDTNTHLTMGESSQILDYLEKQYASSPRLFSLDPKENEKIKQWLIEFDSKLALVGRRLGYTQIILENPTILATLFLSNVCKGVLTWPIINRASSAILAMLLIKRFRFDLNESLDLYEELESYLLSISHILATKDYVVNNHFTAVDLTLAVYLRTIKIIPFFKENPKLTRLFSWQDKMLLTHQREPKLLYEILLEEHRKKHPPVRRKIQLKTLRSDFFKKIDLALEKNQQAYNDQEPIWTWRILLMPYYYFFKIRKNKIRQELSTKDVR